MASRCVGCQNRDAAIADLTKEVERFRRNDELQMNRAIAAERKLARLVEGLEAHLKRCAIFRQQPMARDLRELIATATGEGK